MPKPKFTTGKKIEIIEAFRAGKVTKSQLRAVYGMNPNTIYKWLARYEVSGMTAFIKGPGNVYYSKEFKLRCVRAYLNGDGSLVDLTAKYKLSSSSLLWHWVKCYNANMELKDYAPKREVYMAEAKRKTTLEERREIVAYCIEHNNDYKGTAFKFQVSYSQVYSWVKKYHENGVSGLEDRRGHHKSDDDLDELERLRRENKRLKQQLEERDMLCELLKKVRELEGM